MEKWEPHTLLVGMWNDVAALENRSAVPQKVRGRVTVWSSSSTPRCIPNGIKRTC